MARVRYINPGFFMDDDLAELPPLSRILFAGLWCIADREGRLRDRPRRIKAEALPYDDCDVDAMLTQLHERQFIHRYEVEGSRYIAIPKWKRYQNPHHKEADSMLPPCLDHAWTMLESSTGHAWTKLARSNSNRYRNSNSIAQAHESKPDPTCADCGKLLTAAELADEECVCGDGEVWWHRACRVQVTP